MLILYPEVHIISFREGGEAGSEVGVVGLGSASDNFETARLDLFGLR